MPLTALALTLAAAVLHAVWNALARRAQSPFLFLWSAFGCSTLLLLPAAVWLLARDGFDPRAAIPLVVTGIVHAVYFYSLGAAYERAYFSQVYPIARGLGVSLVPVVGWPVLGETLSVAGALGILVVTTGIAVLSLGATRRDQPRQRGGLGWAALTGATIGVYSVNDKIGVRYLHPVPYLCFLGLGSMALLLPRALDQRPALASEWKERRGTILCAGLFSVGAYLLVLLAFRLSKAAYVVAGRELSIVLSTIIGGVWLGEGWPRLRLIGSVLIVGGVVAVTLAR